VVTEPDIPGGPEAEDPLDRPGLKEQVPPGLDPRTQFNGDRPGPPAGYSQPPPPPYLRPSAYSPPAEKRGPVGNAYSLRGDPPRGRDPRAMFIERTGSLASAPGPAFVQDGEPSAQASEQQASALRGGQSPEGGRSRVRLRLTIAAAVLGLAGLVASIVGVAVQVLPRKFSAAQQHQIMAWQIASRWRIWPAGKIFPATIGYTDTATSFGAGPSGLPLDAHRAGIAPQSNCVTSIDRVLARVLERHGCTAVLRATYTDATGTFVVTLGVVVSRGTAPAPGTLPGGRGIRPGVKPVAFHGTLAARFGVRQRQLANAISYGPYLILYTAGYTDGRRRDQVAANPYIDSEMTSVASGIARAVGVRLGSPPPPPTCPGAPGC
jgi:hypothetical protein